MEPPVSRLEAWIDLGLKVLVVAAIGVVFAAAVKLLLEGV